MPPDHDVGLLVEVLKDRKSGLAGALLSQRVARLELYGLQVNRAWGCPLTRLCCHPSSAMKLHSLKILNRWGQDVLRFLKWFPTHTLEQLFLPAVGVEGLRSWWALCLVSWRSWSWVLVISILWSRR